MGECVFKVLSLVVIFVVTNLGCVILFCSHIGIKQLIFGGQRLGDWEEGMTDPEDGYKSFKI